MPNQRTSLAERGSIFTPGYKPGEKKESRKVEKETLLHKANFQIPLDLYRRAKHHAVDRRMKLYELIAQALTEYLDRHKAS